MSMLIIIFDPKSTVSYPLFRCPTCQSEFYGGGPALHGKLCPERGYGKCHTLVGLKMIEIAKERIAEGRGDVSQPFTSITPNQMKAQLPTYF